MSSPRLRFVFLVLVLTTTPTFVAAQPTAVKLPSDQAVLELDVPNGTQISLGGKERGTQTLFTFKPMAEGRWYRFSAEATFPGGKKAEVPLLLQGGWHVRLPLRPATDDLPKLVLQTGHTGAVVAVAFSPDGRRVLTGAKDGTAILWDVASGRQLRTFREPTNDVIVHRHVNAVAFSADGQRLLTGTQDGKAILWDIQRDRPLRTFGSDNRTFQGHSGPVYSVALSTDGQRLLTYGDNRGLIWDVTTGKVLRTLRPGDHLGPEDHTSGVSTLVFSPDGQHLLTGGNSDTKAILWDTTRDRTAAGPIPGEPLRASGKPLRSFKGHTRGVITVALSPDGKRVLTGSWDKTAILWDAASGQQLRILKGHEAEVKWVAFSGDGNRLLTYSRVFPEETIRVWDAGTGQQLRTLKDHKDAVEAVALSPDGKQVLTGSARAAILWDVESGRQLRTFQGQVRAVEGVYFGPDGQRLLIGSTNRMAVLWDPGSGRALHTLRGRTSLITGSPFSPDGKRVLTGAGPEGDLNSYNDALGAGSQAILWDADTGQKLRTLKEQWVQRATLTRDGKRVLTTSSDDYRRSKTTFWEADSGKELRTLPALAGGLVGLSADGRRGLSGSGKPNQLALWDLDTGQQLRTFQGAPQSSLRVSPDFRRLFFAAWDASAQRAVQTLWDIETGRQVKLLQVPIDPETSQPIQLDRVTFDPQGRRLVTFTSKVLLWDAETGQLLQTLDGPKGPVAGTTFSPDGKLLLISYQRDDFFKVGETTTILWDTEHGHKLRTLEGYPSAVRAVAFSPDNRRLLLGSEDGTARLWDLATGQELCQLVSLNEGRDWLVATSEGLFDGSLGGRQQVSYRVGRGLNIVPVDRFFQDFYYPGLLTALWRGERPMPGVKIAEQQPPIVRILSPKTGGAVEEASVTIEVEAEDRGGGIKGPWLLHNGARVLSPGQPRREGQKLQRSYTVALVEGENRLEVKAASSDGSWESEPARIMLKYAKPLAKAQLHLLVVGINQYATGAMNLRFAAPDARAVADLFTRRGQALYRQVHTHTLLDDQATRMNLREKLKLVAQQAQPQDAVLLFLAGHGTMVGQRYYFIPHNFKRSEGSLEDDIRAQAVPGDEIGEYLAAVPALKRVLVFDTCQSGGAIGLTRTARNPFAFRGAIERLSRAQGVFTIAASAASEEAQEVAELKHGVLTYALLAGLKSVRHGPLSERGIQTESPERVASVLEWFNFASGQVPRLTQRYFGREQDVQTSSQGQSFPLLPLEDQ